MIRGAGTGSLVHGLKKGRAALFALAVVLPLAMASAPDSNKQEQRAKELVLDVCTSCHDMARVRIQALSKEEWAGLIKGMLSEGAAVSDEEMDLIVNYLAEHFGYKPNQKDSK
jgi:hypothetical protein